MTNNAVPHLIQEYEYQKALFENQPTIMQRFLESQAQFIANALITKTSQVRFTLPDRVVTLNAETGQKETLTVPEAQRQIVIRGFLQRDVRGALIRRLNEWESSVDQAMAVSAGLLRYATAMYLVQDLLPAGRTVAYLPNADEEFPTIPVKDGASESAITQASDAIVEQEEESERGTFQTPFVPAARIFFLPQWVAFDSDGKLLVGSVREAEAHIQSMQHYVSVLHTALSLAPYISASEEYQHKRYGMLGQLINQGRALASFKTHEIICEIKSRADKQSLNRGLAVSIPYFDDQTLLMDQTNFEVIPAGRIMFIPAFVVRASRSEQAKVAQDTRLNISTRKHLLTQLEALETAFLS